MAISMDDIKKLSPQARAMIIIFVIIIIGYLDWFYFLSDALDKKTTLSRKLEEIQGQNKEKEKITLQLDKYKADVASLQENYKVALQKLPDQRELPGLFLSISQAGKEAGIDFLLFEPKAAVPRMIDKPVSKDEPKAAAISKPSDQKQIDTKPTAGSKPATDGKKAVQQEPEPFYEEIPVTVTVVGSFQNTIFFFEKVASLPRIINISDISMGERKDTKGRQGYVINTSCTIKTYMFVDKKEKASETAK
jgi:type IV pilus assembly protein PilO